MKALSMAVTAALVMLASSPSHALTFDFSFTNASGLGTDPGTVTGEIVGLSNNATSAATAVYIDSFPTAPFLLFGDGPFSLQLPEGTPFNVISPFDQLLYNSFTVSDDQITNAEFSAKIFSGDQNDGGTPTNTFGLGVPNYDPPSYFTYVDLLSNGVIPNLSVGADIVSFTPIPPPTPLPAALPLFATGLGVIGLFVRRRRRKNGAALQLN
jgi:hypothetical protein